MTANHIWDDLRQLGLIHDGTKSEIQVIEFDARHVYLSR
jgi:hypothetical protein